MSKRKFGVGSRVLLSLKISDATSMLEPFNNRFYTISSIRRVKDSTLFYTLEGVESDYGIPYTISEEWIEAVN